jgi:hypothetical protein
LTFRDGKSPEKQESSHFFHTGLWVDFPIKSSIVARQLMPVILATQETEIKRIMVQSHPREIVCETLSQKYSTQKRADGVAQVVEYLPSNGVAPSSNPSTTKKRKKNKNRIVAGNKNQNFFTVRCFLYKSSSFVFSYTDKHDAGKSVQEGWSGAPFCY